MLGVQKERMSPKDMFVLALSTQCRLRSPPSLKPSACTPLFLKAYTLRMAGACIHTHSQNAVMVTLLCKDEFKITHQEMIKGIKKGATGENMMYNEMLVIPIVENTLFEEELTSHMAKVWKNRREEGFKCVSVLRGRSYDGDCEGDTGVVA
jgi:methylthioribulose-1-phosphate dehydratase